MFATEENIKRLKRAQELQERLDKLKNCPCLSLAEEEKIKNELKEILDKLRYDEPKDIGLRIEPEKECKHIITEDAPIINNRFKCDIGNLKMENDLEVFVYKCVNCGGNFVMDRNHNYAYPLIFNALGQISLGKKVDVNQCPTLNVINNVRTNYYRPLFKNQNSILYLRAISQLGEETTSIEILKLMEELNNADNKKLDAVYKDTANKIKNVTFGL